MPSAQHDDVGVAAVSCSVFQYAPRVAVCLVYGVKMIILQQRITHTPTSECYHRTQCGPRT